MSRSCAVLAAAIALFSSVGVARAQDTQLDEAARLTFVSAREAFVAGDYERALGLFRQAYELSQRPGLLYNIAQTLDRLRRDAETLQALRDYLEAYPDAPNEPEVRARIRVLQASVDEDEQRRVADERRAEEARRQAAAGASTPPVAADEGGGLAILHPAIFIAAGGLALAAGGLAIWSGLETISLNDAYAANTDPATVGAAYDDAQSMQLLANVFIFSAAGLAAAAAVFAVLTDWGAFEGGGDSALHLRPALAVGPSGGSLGLEGSF